MQTVFPSHARLAHVWASGSQQHGSAGNLSFTDGVLYSYGTPVARIVTDLQGDRVALFTSRTYSTSTSRQVSYGRRAWQGNGLAFTVPSLGVSGGRHREPSNCLDVDHAANIEALTAAYRDTLARFMRMQSRPYSDSVNRWLTEQRDSTVDYAQHFGVAAPHFDVAADMATVEQRFARLDAKRADPVYTAKRERDRAQREERKAAKAAVDRERRLAEIADKVTAWRAGESIHLPWDAPMMLRVNPANPGEVQTSRDAVVPLDHARRLFGIVSRCRDKRANSTQCELTDSDRRVGLYRVNAIAANGDMVIGCHHIPWNESAAFAESQGWAAAPQEVQS